MAGVGASWRRRTAQAGNERWMCVATVMLASSIISSTMELVSRSSYMPTSVGLFVSSSSLNLTSGDARLSAPASNLHGRHACCLVGSSGEILLSKTTRIRPGRMKAPDALHEIGGIAAVPMPSRPSHCPHA